MNRTTKSCSTYLSANRLQRGHCISRTSPPPVPVRFASPPPLGIGVGDGEGWRDGGMPAALDVL